MRKFTVVSSDDANSIRVEARRGNSPEGPAVLTIEGNHARLSGGGFALTIEELRELHDRIGHALRLVDSRD